MLKIVWILACLIFTLEAFACLRVEGIFSVDGEDLRISQKTELGKEYALPFQGFILSFTLHPMPKSSKSFNFKYKVEERAAKSLEMVSLGEEEINIGEKRQIYAKGLEKKPNSILDLKLTKI